MIARELATDLETYSPVNLKTEGMFRYMEHPEFEILMLTYRFDDKEPVTVDIKNGEVPPDEYFHALTNPSIKKTAFNAPFEINGLERHYGLHLDPHEWECTMVAAGTLGLPMKLETTAKVLALPEQKDTAGSSLIDFFSKPCKPTKTNGGRTRNLPEHAPEKWRQYLNYNRQDVITETAIRDRIRNYPLSAYERRLWALDQEINRRGVLLDMPFVHQAIRLDAVHKEKLTREAVELTGLDNPNSVAQLKAWLSEEMDREVTTLAKKAIPPLLEACTDDTVRRVLELRKELAKSSVKKYAAMLKRHTADNRFCGGMQFYGANRTGRWAGRGVQVHNLAKSHMDIAYLDYARQLVAAGDLETLEHLYGSVPDTLSQLIRTSFIAAPGYRLLVTDLSAIEARIVAWLAQEKWRMEVFNTHGKIYEASASQMFKVPLESITKGSPLRQRGKVSELALGYQGSTGALITMGALEEGLQEHELKPLVDLWRAANPKIKDLWYAVQDCAIDAVRDPGRITRYAEGKPWQITFRVERGVLFITLPSGRDLAYVRPRLVPGKYGDQIRYSGLNDKKQWGHDDTYGGKLVENITQAIARDVLADAMLRLSEAGYHIVMHVHDEVVLEERNGFGSIEEVNRIMSTPIPWAVGLPLGAAGFESQYYYKD